MPLFDFYIMLDWSGAARRIGGRSDMIWIAQGDTSEKRKRAAPAKRPQEGRLDRTGISPLRAGGRHLLVYNRQPRITDTRGRYCWVRFPI
jgi:hypothetical protein